MTLDADGAQNNSNAGLALFHSPNNTIGVTTGNLFSANGSGIWIYGPESSGNVIQHNAIGTDLSLTQADGNGVGVLIQDAPDNQIGIVGSGNLISGNKSVGVQIGAGRQCDAQPRPAEPHRHGHHRAWLRSPTALVGSWLEREQLTTSSEDLPGHRTSSPVTLSSAC